MYFYPFTIELAGDSEPISLTLVTSFSHYAMSNVFICNPLTACTYTLKCVFLILDMLFPYIQVLYLSCLGLYY